MVVKPLTGWKRVALNIFIAVHVAMLFIWGLPAGALRTTLAQPTEKYMMFSGLWHIWGMFAPKPLDLNFDVRAMVKYQDGSTAEWIAPRMEELSIAQRFSKERFRKWRERIRSEDHRMVWDDTSRWIARQMNRNPKNPPVEVQLTRWWVEIPPPDLTRDYQPQPKKVVWNKSFTYSKTAITPKDLQ